MQKNSLVIIELDSQTGIRIRRDLHKSPRWLGVDKWLFDQTLGISGFRVAGLDALDRIFIIKRADREFFNSRGVNTMVLPVPVAAENEDIFDILPFEPLKKRVRLGAVAVRVRVVVAFAGPVGPYHGSRRNEDFPCGIAGREGALEPLALGRAPERFFGTGRGFVVRAVVAAFEEPELQIFADAVCAVIRRLLVTGRMDGHLLAKQIGAGRGERELVTGLIGIIEAEVMVVLEPIGRRVGEKFDHARKAELLVPFLTKLGKRLGGMLDREVVIDGVTRSDEEIGLELFHGGEGGIAEVLVLIARGDWPATIGLTG